VRVKDEEAEDGNVETAATITKIYETRKFKKMIEVRWFYFPQDINGGRQKHHFANELFDSTHFDIVECSTVIKKIQVQKLKAELPSENEDDEEEDENENEETTTENSKYEYVCRFTYNLTEKAFVPLNLF